MSEGVLGYFVQFTLVSHPNVFLSQIHLKNVSSLDLETFKAKVVFLKKVLQIFGGKSTFFPTLFQLFWVKMWGILSSRFEMKLKLRHFCACISGLFSELVERGRRPSGAVNLPLDCFQYQVNSGSNQGQIRVNLGSILVQFGVNLESIVGQLWVNCG